MTLRFVEPYERIRQLRQALGLSQEKLGLAVGYDIGQARQRVSKIEKNRVPMTTNDLRKFAEALQTTPSNILDGAEEPSKGGGAGKRSGGGGVVGTVVEQGEAIPLVSYGQNGEDRRVVGYVERPPSLRGVRHGYAIYAFDDRMEPRYSPGWLLYVNPTKPPRPGRDVFVVRHNAPPLVRQLESRGNSKVVLRALADKEASALEPDDILELHLIVGSDQEG